MAFLSITLPKSVLMADAAVNIVGIARHLLLLLVRRQFMSFVLMIAVLLLMLPKVVLVVRRFGGQPASYRDLLTKATIRGWRRAMPHLHHTRGGRDPHAACRPHPAPSPSASEPLCAK